MVARETSLAGGLRRLGLTSEGLLTRLDRFTTLLIEVAVPAGFVGPAEQDRLIERHILESASLGSHLVPGSVVDVGSGAGLPGVVLACLEPERSVILIEASARRSAFLRRAVHELGLPRARVLQARAEEVARGEHRASADCATARALARPQEALELLLPLTRVGGRCLVPVGSREVPGHLLEAARALGGADPRMARLEVPGAKETRWVMIVDKLRPTPDTFPRPPSARRRRSADGAVE